MTRLGWVATACAVAAWAGVGGWWWVPAVAVLPVLLLHHRIPWAAAMVTVLAFVAGLVSGALHRVPPEALPAGPVNVSCVVEVAFDSTWGWSGVVRSDRGSVLLRLDSPPPARRFVVEGRSDGIPRWVAGRWARATVTGAEVIPGPAGSPHEAVASSIADRIDRVVQPGRSEWRALLVGFLTGDTSGVSVITQDEMRAAGLSHLVAVSGSNVALFLVAALAVSAPVSMFRTGRLLVTLNALIVFGIVTRWEPSVVRASAAAATVSAGRYVGIPLDPATVLGGVTAIAVIADPTLAGSLGFQLSVLASAGLVVGARWTTGRNPLTRVVASTVAAQLAVAPLLVSTFGSVPMLSPLANVIAVPLVGVATMVAGVASASGVTWLVTVAALPAWIVAAVARVAAPWPRIGWWGLSGAVLLSVAAARGGQWRRSAIVACAFIAAAAIAWPGPSLPDGVIFLDIGQGDAAVVHVEGLTVLVDGGPDPSVLSAALRRNGVKRIDLVVATHAHADHTAGLAGIVGRVPIGAVWERFAPHRTPASDALMEAVATAGIPVRVPRPGDTVTVGDTTIEVVAPNRRYDGTNDQSIVLVVDIAGLRFLMAGDIESIAQGEVSVAGVDVLKVPHHGGGTSDPDWLAAHAGGVAVISVGENSFGHPAPWVISTLEEAGASVFRTDRDGDVVVTPDGTVSAADRR